MFHRIARYFLALFFSLAVASVAHAAPVRVEMKTSLGSVVLELYPDKTPKTVDNFLQYVREDFFSGTIFHRVIDGFMIQGGGFTPDMQEKPSRPGIQNEAKFGLKNERGTLAMARTNDPHSAASQFFINLATNSYLDYPSRDGWGYVVFGRVIEGMDVVNKIAKVRTGNAGFYQDVPTTPILIESVRILAEKPTENSNNTVTSNAANAVPAKGK